jgi:hypothetical protein
MYAKHMVDGRSRSGYGNGSEKESQVRHLRKEGTKSNPSPFPQGRDLTRPVTWLQNPF